MTNSKKLFCKTVIILISLLCFCPPLYANNLSISNVSLADRNPDTDTVVVELDVSWDNSWKTKINYDAVWLTFRLSNPTTSPTDKKLCQITASGVNPTGTSVGSNANFEISVPSDKKGAFIRPNSYGTTSSVALTKMRVSLDYSSCGFNDEDSVTADVLGLEMVLVPQGSFYAGDYGTSTGSLVQGSADTDPWSIGSEGAISVTNAASNGYRYVSAGNTGESATGSSFTIPATYPKGYNAFYVMKYEINEGEWVDFINSLPSASARLNRDSTNSSHKNSDSVQYRNTLSCSGSPLVCTSDRPHRALGYISWMDLAAFLDWAALRPMTELEFEKAARGPVLPTAGEFAWGSTALTAASTISAGDETGSETATNSGVNAHFNDTALSGGDAVNGADYQKGPLRNGIFAGPSPSRGNSGAGYYGAFELSGNLKERVVTIGNSAGLNFLGTNGDGVLSTASGYEGDADAADWPGMDAVIERGITGANGSGSRGGAWDDQSSGSKLRISDRSEAALSSTLALPSYGGRGARTYEQ